MSGWRIDGIRPGYSVNVLTSDDCVISVGGDDDAVSVANARLVAAAPEMLAALLEVCAAYDSREPGYTDAERLTVMVREARFAIAKATGDAL